MKNIYLEPNEEIISIIDRLIQVEDEQVNLIVPSGAQIWQSSINLKLLKREMDSLNKLVTFIVSDDLSAEMAERIGFAVKKERDLPVELIQEKENIQEEETIQEEIIIEKEEPIQSKKNMIELLVDELESEKKEKKPFPSLALWKRKKLEEIVPKEESSHKRMADIIIPNNQNGRTFLKEKPIIREEPMIREESIVREEPIIREESILREEPMLAKGLKWSRLFKFFIIIALIMACLVGYLVLPSAEVNITPKTEITNFDLSVIGSSDISEVDAILNKIPIQEVEVTKTKSREFNTTGEEEINTKASGEITIYNEYSSDDQTLLDRTRFESSDGKIFRILQGITVPGAKIEEGKIIPSIFKVNVTADQPGEEYNIGSDNFIIPGFKGSPKFAGFYGRSSDSMSGGYVGMAKVVLAEDLEKAENTLVNELKEEVKRALEEQIPTDLKVVENGLKEEIVEISSNFKRGERADKFILEVKVTMKALLFKEDDLKNLVDLNLVSMVSNDKTPVNDTQKISWQTPTIDWSNQEISFDLNIEEKIAWNINTQSIKENLAGQNEIEVRSYLANQSEIERARVSFWPFWVKKIPNQEKKIKVNIEL